MAMLPAMTRKQTQFRIPSSKLALIDRVAALEGRSRTDVVVEAATQYSENVLAEQTEFIWSQEDLSTFDEILARPANPSDYVVHARAKKRVWDV